MVKLKKDDVAPGFALKDQAGKTVKLDDFKGRKLLVYFYPKAGTSG
jgi:peroxiredoxin Q/BCP